MSRNILIVKIIIFYMGLKIAVFPHLINQVIRWGFDYQI